MLKASRFPVLCKELRQNDHSQQPHHAQHSLPEHVAFSGSRRQQCFKSPDNMWPRTAKLTQTLALCAREAKSCPQVNPAEPTDREQLPVHGCRLGGARSPPEQVLQAPGATHRSSLLLLQSVPSLPSGLHPVASAALVHAQAQGTQRALSPLIQGKKNSRHEPKRGILSFSVSSSAPLPSGFAGNHAPHL